MNLEHTRLQLPVGQGFFHSGDVSIAGVAFRYVYDCGSENERALDRVISGFIDELSGAQIDVLFLSHLDADHVCGLDRLLTYSRAKTAVLPYLSPTQRIILVAAAAEEGNLDGSLLSLLCDPTAWLTSRGIETVIYISSESSPEEEGPDWTVGPDFGPLTPSAGSDRPIRERLTASKDEPPRLQLAIASLTRSERLPLPHRRYSAQAFVLSCLQPLRFETLNGFVPNWQFVTFVHPEGAREEAFRKRVLKSFGRKLVSQSGFEVDQGLLLSILQNEEQRDRLAGCYTEIRSDRNLTSLAVYSGPIDLCGVAVDYQNSSWGRSGDNRCAWLGTGDANLLTHSRRLAFVRHYRSLQPIVSTFTLPHHGSRHNFHTDLLTFGNVFVASAGHTSRYDHPHVEVAMSVEARHSLHVVTEELRSRLMERVVLEPAPSAQFQAPKRRIRLGN